MTQLCFTVLVLLSWQIVPIGTSVIDTNEHLIGAIANWLSMRQCVVGNGQVVNSFILAAVDHSDKCSQFANWNVFRNELLWCFCNLKLSLMVYFAKLNYLTFERMFRCVHSLARETKLW